MSKQLIEAVDTLEIPELPSTDLSVAEQMQWLEDFVMTLTLGKVKNLKRAHEMAAAEYD